MPFDPFSPEFVHDPYPIYRVLRDAPTATWCELLDGWLITRFDDVRTVLREHSIFSSDDRYATRPRMRPKDSPSGRNIISSDPPSHTRFRRILAREFSPRWVGEWTPRIRDLAAGLLDNRTCPDQLDVMGGLAIPLPVQVIAEMLGIPPADREQCQRWAENEISPLTMQMSAAEAARRETSSRDLRAYLRSAISEARGQEESGRHLMGRVSAAGDDQETLSEDELVALAVLLLIAGSSTTTHLIGNGMLALLRNPGQLAQLRRRPHLMEPAIEELLRYDAPVQSVYRVVRRTVRLHGVTLAPGDGVFAVLSSANRDERRYKDPDDLKLDRDDVEHLAFGSGVHYCVGAVYWPAWRCD